MLPDQQAKRSSWLRGKRLVLLIGGCILLALIIRFVVPLIIVVFVAQPVRFVGQSMMPNIHDEDRLFLDKRLGKLGRGDIIAFRYPQDTSKSYIKRIIGLPGEEIEIRNGKVFINGSALEEPYTKPNYLSDDTMPPMKIAEQHYFVLGDNRRNSSDSRYWGTVARDLIYGKVMARYWPPGEAVK